MAATTTPTSDLSTFLGSDPEVERLYDNVQAVVPAVQLPMLQLETWNTIEDFYIQSTCRRELAYWTMPTGVDSVDFNPFDADWLVCWILHFTGLNCARIDPHTARLRDLTCPIPQTTRTGRALLALKPVSFSSELSPLLWMQWFQPILSGVLYRLYAQPLKPYSSPQQAQFHGRKYMSGVAKARMIAEAEFTDGGGRWGFPYFAHGRRKN